MNLKSLFTTLLILLTSLQFHVSFCQNNPQDETCRQPFQCGSFPDLRYPFSGGNRPPYCGHPGFELTCSSQNDNTLLINISSQPYRILEIDNSSNTMRITRQDLYNTLCPTTLTNTTLNFTLFDYMSNSNDQNVTLFYGCTITVPQPTPPPYQFTCGTDRLGFYLTRATTGLGTIFSCENRVLVPVSGDSALSLSVPESSTPVSLQSAIGDGFWVEWSAEDGECDDCTESGGVCGYDRDSMSFACYCQDQTYPLTCNNMRIAGNGRNEGLSNVKKFVVGLLVSITCVVTLAVLAVYLKRRGLPNRESNQKVEHFLVNHGSLASKRYNYSQIKKMTKSFKDKLGKGGYGSVYKGILPDGTLVAVKLLTETSSNGEEFINEVTSISRTSHVNIVNLLGFCYDKSKRALIYEYMPNKSLDKFIVDTSCQLDWNKLHRIAVGVARGLEYLHGGCNTRIVHFDIKPSNILLDEDFCPKISDFGLAKLCKKKQSLLSMLGTRGTIGFIAPEVFSRNYGGVSHKSDVYSYGMTVLEMAGAKKFVRIGSIHSSENYFPDQIYDHFIIGGSNKFDHVITCEEEDEITRKMFFVGFWCIQTIPSDRPSMSKVVEMLEGSIQSNKIPPKPVLFALETSGKEIPSSASVNIDTGNSIESWSMVDSTVN